MAGMSRLFHKGPMWLQVFFSTKQQHTRPDSFNQLISVFRKLIGQTVCFWLVGTKTCSHTALCGIVWTCLHYGSATPNTVLVQHVSPHLSIGPNDGTESQHTRNYIILMVQPSERCEITGEKACSLIDSVGRKQRNGGIWLQQPPRWIHTSVIFTPAWTGTVNNTSAHASGVWRRPSSQKKKHWCLDLCETLWIKQVSGTWE